MLDAKLYQSKEQILYKMHRYIRIYKTGLQLASTELGVVKCKRLIACWKPKHPVEGLELSEGSRASPCQEAEVFLPEGCRICAGHQQTSKVKAETGALRRSRIEPSSISL